MFLLCSDTNKTFGVLLSDGCRPTSRQSSSHPSTPTTDTLHTRSTLETVRGRRWTTARPVVPGRTASHDTSSRLTESTPGGAGQSTAEATTAPPVSSSSLLPTSAGADSTLDVTTVAPEFTPDTETTAGAFKSPLNSTHLDNRTTPTSFPDSTEVDNVASDDSVSPDNMYDIATTSSQREQLTDVTTMSNTTGATAGRNQTRKDYLTTVTSPSNPVYFNTTATTDTNKTEESFTVDNRNHHNHTNTTPYAAEYSRTTVTTPSNNATTETGVSGNTADVDGKPHQDTATTRSTNTPSSHTTSYNYLAQHNRTDSSKTHNNTFTPNYNTTGANSVTHDDSRTAVNSVATAANTDTTVPKNYTAEFNNTTGGTTTRTLMPSSDDTNMKDNATVSASSVNTTTVSPNKTLTGSLTTSAFRETQQVALATSASEVYAVSNAAAITRNSAPPHGVAPSSHSYTPANTAAGGSAANVSQTTSKSKDPAVTSSATTGNAGLAATDTSNRRGPTSAGIGVTATTPPLASASATISSTTKPGMYSSKLLHLKMLRHGEEEKNSQHLVKERPKHPLEQPPKAPEHRRNKPTSSWIKPEMCLSSTHLR